MKRVTFFASVLNLLFLFSCCKDTNRPPGNNPVNFSFFMDTTKPWIDFKPGTTWIYKNIQTNELDTQVVVDYFYDTLEDKGTKDYSMNTTITYDYLYYKVTSSLGHTREYFTNSFDADLTQSMIKWGFLLSCRTVKGIHSSEDASIKFPFIAGDGPYRINEASMEKKLDTLTVAGTLYYNVYVVLSLKDATWSPPSLETIRYYWAENVGIIRREIDNLGVRIDLIDKTIIK